MQKEQKKGVLVNILTVVVLGGLLFAGYVVFFKVDTVPTDGNTVSVAQIAEDTAAIGTQIKSTKKELSDLTRAVASSTVVFEKSAFKNLEDFTVLVPSEPAGRDNPFVPTAWKIKMQALGAAGGKIAPSFVPVLEPKNTTQASSTNFLGNFGGGVL